MKGKQKFFICNRCGNIIGLVADKGGSMSCCGDTMVELIPNTVEASTEKHLPEVTMSGDNVVVQVGSVLHPMEEAHYIAFIYIETELGGQRKTIKIGEDPKQTFSFVGDKPVAVYAYCNLHGLWKTEC